MTIVDADTGVVRAIRLITWGQQFAAAVRRAIRAQGLNASTEAEGAAAIDRWYARYPTTKDLVRAADITTSGGRAP